MVANVLVVEEMEEFGSLIRNALEETGRYQVSLAMNADEAIELGDRENIHLLIIDFDLSEADAPACIQRIQSTNPDMAIIAIPPNNDPHDPALSNLPIRGMLTKPFYLPELNEIVSAAIDLPTQPVATEQIQESLPQEAPFIEVMDTPAPWADDADRTTQYLARICDETSAEAVILLHHGRQWAQTGGITADQAQGLAEKIAEIGVGSGARGAITTLTRLPGTQRDCILYANGLMPNWILALIYPSGTSFGIIRRQARHAADRLKYTDLSGHEEELPPIKVSAPDTAPISTRAEEDISFDEIFDAEPETQEMPFFEDLDLPSIKKSAPDTAPVSARDEEETSFDEIFDAEPEAQEMPFFDDLDLPPPEPDEAPAEIEEHRIEEADTVAAIPGDWVPDKPKPESHLPFLDEDAFPDSDSTPDAQEPIPLPDAEYYLPVTAVLVPRFPEHRLTGALAENLQQWVIRLCLAWDWRADEVSIEPDYLCLTMSISQETAPSNAVFRLRDDLSQRILSAFPEFVDDLPSRRFWARSYLLITGGSPPTERLHAFVEATRKAQGIEI
ncbi:MAG: response regulator [Anaerolineales bacterium]|jgi:CheY-like chemotaxis protein